MIDPLVVKQYLVCYKYVAHLSAHLSSELLDASGLYNTRYTNFMRSLRIIQQLNFVISDEAATCFSLRKYAHIIYRFFLSFEN